LDALDGMDDLDAVTAQEQAQRAFATAQHSWGEALAAHRLAPPDAGFSARLGALASAAGQEADACRAAAEAGFAWPPHRASDSGAPCELRPESGRRGPVELWRRFDGAVAQLSRVATGNDLLAVADAYEELAAATDELSRAVEAQDRESGLLRHRRGRNVA
jgi:hypothetical protein